MQISSLDLTMQHETDKILEISHNVAKATEVILEPMALIQRWKEIIPWSN